MKIEISRTVPVLLLWAFATTVSTQEAPADQPSATPAPTEQPADAAPAPASAGAEAQQTGQNDQDSAPAHEAATPARGDPKSAEDALRNEAKATVDTEESSDAAPDSASTGPGKDEDGDFIPTEKIWADSAIAFPSDI
jgi:hypothetical protein